MPLPLPLPPLDVLTVGGLMTSMGLSGCFAQSGEAQVGLAEGEEGDAVAAASRDEELTSGEGVGLGVGLGLGPELVG